MKHFFSVPSVHFVLVVNMEQLESSVRGVYGSDIDARTYLEKFYHLRVTLPESLERRDVRSTDKFIDHIARWLPDDQEGKRFIGDTLQELRRLAKHNSMTLRTIERVMSYIALSVLHSTKRHLRLAPIVADLCAMRVERPTLFAKAKENTLSVSEVEGYLGISEPEVTAGRLQNLRLLWIYFTEKNLPDDPKWGPYSRMLFDYSIDREHVIAAMANQIVDKFTLAN